MYIYEVRESSVYVPEHYSWFVKDDEESLSKIKKIVIDFIKDSILECEERILEDEGVCTYKVEALLDLKEDLQEKLDEVSRYVFVSQFTKVSLLSSNITISRAEVL